MSVTGAILAKAGPLINQIGDAKLRGQMLEVQAEAIKINEQNRGLVKETEELRAALQLQESLTFNNDDNFYYRVIGADGERDGPYCSACWDGERKLIRLHNFQTRLYGCPWCWMVRNNRGEPANRVTVYHFRVSSGGGEEPGRRR